MKKLQQKIFFLIFYAPVLVFAQGYQVNLQGQAQQGMGGAGTAFMQDAAALFFNPGGVSFLTDRSINLGVSPTFAKSTFLDKNTNQTANTDSPSSFPFAAYGVCGANDSSS